MRRLRNPGLLSSMGLVGACALACGTAAADAPKLVTHSFGPVPGFDPPSVYSGNYDYAIISNSNDMVFADVAGAPSGDPNNPLLFGLLLSRPADMTLPMSIVAADSHQAPNAPANTSAFFPRDPRIDDSGRIAFITNFERRGPVDSYNDNGLYFGTPADPHLVIRAGDPAPGIPGMNIEFLPGHYALSQSTGKVAFNAFYLVAPRGATAGQGVWGGTLGDVRLIAKTGDPVPGMPGSHFDSFATWCVNDLGEVAFVSQLDTEQPDGVQDSVLAVTRADGTIRIVARTGQQAPGMPAGINYWRLAEGAFLDNAGHLAFMGFHTDTSRPPSERRAIWYGPIESPQLLAYIGQQCPGLDPGFEFGDMGGPFMSVSGSVMFRGIIRGPDITFANNAGVWMGTPGDLRLRIRAGDPAPGLPDGVVVNSLSGSFLSSGGRLVVRGQIIGGGVEPILGNLIPDALWADDPSGKLQLIARAGVPMEVEPGNFLTPLGFTLAGERSYAPSQARQFFNSSGRLLFAADFIEDGSAALYTVDVTAPCPADYDRSGTLTVADIFAFLNGWFAGDTAADFDGADGLAVADIFAFLNAWFAGC